MERARGRQGIQKAVSCIFEVMSSREQNGRARLLPEPPLRASCNSRTQVPTTSLIRGWFHGKQVCLSPRLLSICCRMNALPSCLMESNLKAREYPVESTAKYCREHDMTLSMAATFYGGLSIELFQGPLNSFSLLMNRTVLRKGTTVSRHLTNFWYLDHICIHCAIGIQVALPQTEGAMFCFGVLAA